MSVAIVSCDEKQGWEEEVSEGPLPLYLCYASFFYYVLVVDIVEVVIAVVVVVVVVVNLGNEPGCIERLFFIDPPRRAA